MDTVDVILLKDIPKFGVRGDVKTAKRGYAQNYLVKLGLAIIATPQQIAEREKHKVAVERKQQRMTDRGRSAFKKISGKTFSLKARASESGTLYAGVGVQEIVQLLDSEGHTVPMEAIKLSVPIKTVGNHRVTAEQSGVTSVAFIVNVSKE